MRVLRIHPPGKWSPAQSEVAKEDRGNGMLWDVELPVVGRCPDCGDDLAGAVRIHSTAAWIARYHADDRLYSGINRAVERLVIERHARTCGARRQQQQRGLRAAIA